MRRFIRPWSIVATVSLVYMAVIVALEGGGPLSLAMLGTRYSNGDPAGSEGYDGQFAYYVARDPLDGCRPCDAPAYRVQRILYPLLARLLALGQEWLLPYTLPLINVVALAAGTWLVEHLLERYGHSRWYALTYGLYAGHLMAARLDLNEPLAHALAMGGMVAVDRQRWGTAAILLGLAALTKETALAFAAGVMLFLLVRRQWRPLALVALGAGAPFLAWQAVLWAWLGRPGIGSGGAGATGWEIVPFRGLWSVGAIDLRVLALLALVMVPLAVIPSLLGLWAAGRALWRGRWHPFTLVLLVNALVMLFLPQSTYREYLAMLRLTAALVASMLLFGMQKRSNRVLNYSTFWLASLVFLAKEGAGP